MFQFHMYIVVKSYGDLMYILDLVKLFNLGRMFQSHIYTVVESLAMEA